MSRIGITFALGFIGATFLAAQDALRVDVRLVNIYATVIDSSGRYVQGLKKNDFLVEEDGRRQELTHFDHNEDTPVSVGIVLDTSGSMRTKLDTATNAVDRFTRTTISFSWPSTMKCICFRTSQTTDPSSEKHCDIPIPQAALRSMTRWKKL